MGSKKYIHYGHCEFRRDWFCEIQNRLFVKPEGGLWGSPVDSEYGWKDWCDRERFRKCKKSNSFEFTLRDDANVLHIRDVSDLIGLPRNPVAKELLLSDTNMIYLDFEQLVKDGYDAIELHLSEEKFDVDVWRSMDNLYWKLYGWDCDSILVMNAEVIVV